MALPCEIGLYFDFEVTDDGVPYGCPGFESFKPEIWNTSHAATWTRVPYYHPVNPDPYNRGHWLKADPDCPFNKMSVPDGSTPLHEIFEEYATDQQKWVNDFVPTLEKMLSNGYANGELVDGPDQYTGIQCKRQNGQDGFNYYNCRNPEETVEQSEAFFIISRLHGRVAEGKPGGYAKNMPFDPSNPKQLWMETSIGNQFINVATGLPMYAGAGRAWRFGEQQRIFDQSGRALFARWKNEDGVDLGAGNPDSWKAPNQMFVKMPLKEFQAPLEGKRIKIRNDLDKRVIEGKASGDGMMNTIDANNENQLWVQKDVEGGIQFINVATRLPLMISDVSVWTYTDKRTIEVAGEPGRGIDRGWAQKDGQGIVLYNLWYGIIHWFDLIDA